MSQETQTQTLDESLAKTDLGSAISEHKKSILIAFAVIIVGVVVYSIVNHTQSLNKKETLDKVFEAKQSFITPFLDAKEYEQTSFDNIMKISNDVYAQPAFIPSVIEAADKLLALKKEAQAVELLEKSIKFLKTNSYLYFFVGIRLAPLYENTNMNDKAISVYENIKAAKKGVLESDVYLSLGRLYLEAGNKEKAKSNLEFAIKSEENSENANIAKAMLDTI